MISVLVCISFLLLLTFNLYIVILKLYQTGRNRSVSLTMSLTLITFSILYGLSLEVENLFHRIPSTIYVLIILIILGLSLNSFFKEQIYEKTTLTKSSIKESFDNLPMGVSFSLGQGIVVLSNRQMNILSHRITGRELQDAQDFWQKLSDNRTNIQSRHQTSMLYVDNEQTWAFNRHPIFINNKEGVQITAMNVSELVELWSQHQKKSVELEEMNIRLDEYNQNLEIVKTKEERVKTKNRFHSELGYLLLATRKVLVNKNHPVDEKSIFNLWKQNISILLSGSEIQKEKNINTLIDSVSEIGVSFKINGEIPNESKIKEIISMASIEVLNNAIRHADATEITLNIEEKEGEYKIELSNNGIKPDKEIKEGGGLSSLRSHIERLGAMMGYEIEPNFKLWIRMPKRRKEPRYD